MRASDSLYQNINGLRYHLRTWGKAGAPQLFLLHGWMDVSASFQFLVDALSRDWRVFAPDWRGFGLSEWNQGTYWFQDYLADLDALIDCCSPDAPVNLVGHSLGGTVACIYGGVRPERVRRIVSLEGFGVPRNTPSEAPHHYARWLAELSNPPRFRPYASFAEVAERLKKNNPRLTESQAAFLAQHWAKQTETGGVELLSDPKHKIVNAVLYRLEEALACWRNVTAPVLWVAGGASWIRDWLKDSSEEFDQRKLAFRNFSECVIPDAGHMLHLEQPAQVATIIEKFLDTIICKP
ncbi:MAG TPA: alpha/beta hydrolase [Burkholderiales bacterium]|nr:alpha/beta hydrolase [Burkholderiales bacterium]